MAEHTRRIDISNDPELLRLAEEVRRSNEPHVLGRDGEDLAMVIPLPRGRKPVSRQPTAEDLEAFRSAAGSWADIDTDALIERIYRAREEGTRPVDRP